ncbi:STAS domain-containing protein [Streptomyces sp. NPDC016675]|uniref:STAS domain-containing protein n=1 Tax=Streptomyces sp. NPDC016675 TaxID=3364970 RepID=UPI003700A33D
MTGSRSKPVPRVVRLGCARLTTCDSMGLATLLMIERHAGDIGAGLRLDGRPHFLRRLLEVTGTMEYFVPAPSAESPASTEAAGVRRAQQPDGRAWSEQGS